SSEARRRMELGQVWGVSETTSQDPNRKQDPLDPGKFSYEVEAVREQKLAILGSQEETRRWYQGSLDIGKRLAALGPLYETDPSIQFCLQAARRQLGDFDKAREWYARFHSEHSDGPWRD